MAFSFGKLKKEREIAPDILAISPEQIYEAGVLDLQDIIAPSALEVSSNYVKLGEKMARTIFIFTYPRFLSVNWFGSIINLDRVFDISFFVHPTDTASVLRQLQKKVAEVQSQAHEREKKGFVRDPVLDTAYQDLEELRDRLQQATERLFSFGLYLTIYEDTLEDLNRTEAEIRSLLESKLVYAKSAIFQQEPGLISVLPFGSDKLAVHSRLNSSPISTMYPFVSFDLSASKGILYGINRHNNGLILFDRYSLENYNSVIFGKAGGGKSYCTKLEVLRSLMFDTDVIVIDPEREYEYLAEAAGGRYFNISLASKHHINPFELPIAREDESSSDIFRSHVIGLVGLFRIMLGGLTPEEDALIDQAITETYASRDIHPDSDFSKAVPPLLSDLELVLANLEGGESLLPKIRKFTQGTWKEFINQPTNVDINKKLAVFSIRDMEDELRPVATYLIIHYIWSAIRRNLKKRLLVVDEAWWMMKNEDGASFLYGIAKRGRKYFLGLATVTQDVDDFLHSPYGVPIIANSSTQLLLKQSPATIDIVQKTFNLTEEEKFLLLEADIGEGLFFAGLKHAAIKIIASYTEDQIITSDPSQLLAIKKAKEEFAGAQK